MPRVKPRWVRFPYASGTPELNHLPDLLPLRLESRRESILGAGQLLQQRFQRLNHRMDKLLPVLRFGDAHQLPLEIPLIPR